MVVFAPHVQRFFNYLNKGSCWEWQGPLNHDGYGRLWLNSKNVKAHRFSYELFSGEPIPKDKVVRHKCDNPKCSNPFHLMLGTQAQNIQDLLDRKRRPTSYLTKRLKHLMKTE